MERPGSSGSIGRSSSKGSLVGGGLKSPSSRASPLLAGAGKALLGGSAASLPKPSSRAGSAVGSVPTTPSGTRAALSDELAALASDRPLPKAAKEQDTAAAGTPAAAAAAEAAPAASASASASAPEASGVAVVGDNEDNVDDELAWELSRQELMFQQMLRKRAEREAKKKLEKEEKKKADEAKKAAALEACFEGEYDALMKHFDDGIEIECCDQHGNTLLSEAAGGGQTDIVTMLLAEGADPNSIGRYRRTPLWKAAYNGHAETIQVLLRGGADPREYDEQGQKPIDVTPSKEGKVFLLSWDTSSTDELKRQQGAFRRPAGKNAEKEAKAKLKAQETELSAAIEEAEKRLQIAKVEVGKKKKVAQNLRAQKVNLVEQGAEDKVPECEELLERAETEWKEAEKIRTDLEWKLKRVHLKKRDWENEQNRKAQQKAGKLQGYRIEHVLASEEELTALKDMLTSDLELKKALTTHQNLSLRPGDVMIKEPPFGEIRDKRDMNNVEIEEWPVSVWFNHGFDVTIHLKALSDVLLKDVGGKRQTDGRWPLVIDPTGNTTTFLNYAGATLFTALQLKDSIDDEELHLRIRRSLLRCMMYGGAFVIDLQDFDFPLETIEEPINNLEKGLWAKLTDRSCLYSYLLPRRFMRLVTHAPQKQVRELEKDFQEGMFMDNHLQEFVFGFATTYKEPNLEFAKLFYTIRVKDPGEQQPA